MSKTLVKLFTFEKKIYDFFFTKYQTNELLYYHNIIDNIIFNDRTHLVSIFKDYLILDDNYEFLRRFYTKEESQPRLKKTCMYYDLHEKIYPNYSPLPESNLIYHNIIRKQSLHDVKKEKKRKNEKEDKNLNKDNIIFNSSAYNYIINQSNTGLSIFDIEKDNNSGEESINDINNLIDTINKDENQIIISNIYSNRTYHNDNNFNKKDVENKQVIGSYIYKKNITRIKIKNNVINCISKPEKNKMLNSSQSIKKSNENKNKNNPLNQNLINDVDNTKNDYIFRGNDCIKQNDIKNKIRNNKNNIHDIYLIEDNNANYKKLIKNDSNCSTDKKNITYKSTLSHSINREEYLNKYLYTKNFISNKISNNNQIYKNKNIIMTKSISDSNFQNTKLDSFNRSITPNKQTNYFNFCYKNNNCLKNGILQQKTQNNDIINDLLIKEYLLTEEIPKIKVNIKPRITNNKVTKRHPKAKNPNLLIEVNNFENYKLQKTFENHYNFPITDKNFINERNSLVPYRKKYINNTYNHMDSKTFNGNSSTVLYLNNSTGIFPNLANGFYNNSNQRLSEVIIKSPKPNINNKNNYTMEKDHNKNVQPQNELPYEKKKISKNKSFNKVRNYIKENNITYNYTIDSIQNEILNENDPLRNLANNIPFSYKNPNENKKRRSYYPIRLSEINFNNSTINNKAIDNNIDIFNNIIDRDRFFKVSDNLDNYNDYKQSNNIVEKNKTYINININNNIDLNNKNYNNKPKNNLNKTMNQKSKYSTANNRNSLLGNKMQKIKEWKNRKIIDIIRESRLKYVKNKNTNNIKDKSEKNNKLINENLNSIRNNRNQNKNNNKVIKRQYTSSNDNIEIKNKYKFK